MSEVRAALISDLAGTGPATLTKQTAAKAWCRFSGTGTVTIGASQNVSSETDNGTGDYTTNLTSALTDANYAIGIMSGGTGGSDGTAWVHGSGAPTTMTTTALRITTGSSAVGTLIDANNVHVQMMR